MSLARESETTEQSVRGGPQTGRSGKKYDRDHMGYTQKVTNFLRTQGRRPSQQSDFPDRAYRQFWTLHIIYKISLFNLPYFLSLLLDSFNDSSFVLVCNYIKCSHAIMSLARESETTEQSVRGGPQTGRSGKKYDRDHMGYTQKVTNFLRTQGRRPSQQSDFPDRAYRQFWTLHIINQILLFNLFFISYFTT